jgi:hypothetical protein
MRNSMIIRGVRKHGTLWGLLGYRAVSEVERNISRPLRLSHGKRSEDPATRRVQ